MSELGVLKESLRQIQQRSSPIGLIRESMQHKGTSPSSQLRTIQYQEIRPGLMYVVDSLSSD